MADGLGINNPCMKCGRIVKLIVRRNNPEAAAGRRCLGCNKKEDACLCSPLPAKLEFGKPPARAFEPPPVKRLAKTK